MSQKSAPTYNPPAPPTLATASELYNQAQNWYQQNQPELYNAQSTALANVNNPNYYAQWQPTSFENALGNQYFQNVWPDEQALIKQQMSQSGMASSPALAETLGRAYGGLKTQIGSYLSDQANQRATNAINAGLGIQQTGLLSPFVTTGGNQSNAQAGLNYQYQQALAQQEYQNQMNKYQSRNALASTIGQMSPIGGLIYGGATGTTGSAFGGTAQTMQSMLPMLMMAGTGGFGGAGTGTTSSQFGGPLAGYSNAGQNPYSNQASSVYGDINPGKFQY